MKEKCGCRLNAEGTIHAFVQSEECRMAEAVDALRQFMEMTAQWDFGKYINARRKAEAFLAKVAE